MSEWSSSPAQKAGISAEPFFSYIVFFQLILVAKGTRFKNLTGVRLAPFGQFEILTHLFHPMVHNIDILDFLRFWLIQILVLKYKRPTDL